MHVTPILTIIGQTPTPFFLTQTRPKVLSKADPFSHPLNVWIYKLAGTSKCTQTTEASSFPTTVVKTAVIL